jgi:hypothetical protein
LPNAQDAQNLDLPRPRLVLVKHALLHLQAATIEEEIVLGPADLGKLTEPSQSLTDRLPVFGSLHRAPGMAGVALLRAEAAPEGP